MHKSSEDFEIQPDPTTDCGVSCLLSSEKKRCCHLLSLFSIVSISYLQVTMIYIRARRSLKFGQIRLLVSLATDRVLMEKKRCCHFFLAVFFFLIRSFSYLQVMMTCMRARRNSKFSQIRQLNAELAGLERLKNIPIDL